CSRTRAVGMARRLRRRLRLAPHRRRQLAQRGQRARARCRARLRRRQLPAGARALAHVAACDDRRCPGGPVRSSTMSPPPSTAQRVQRLFLSGLLTLLPIWLTWVVVKFVFVLLSDIRRPWVGPVSQRIAAR